MNIQGDDCQSIYGNPHSHIQHNKFYDQIKQWLKKIQPELLYKILSLQKPYLVALFLQARSHEKLTGDRFFSLKADYNSIKNLYIYLKPFSDSFFGFKALSYDPYSQDDYSLYKYRASKIVLNKLRITRTKECYDTVTFSQFYMDDIDTWMEHFSLISQNMFLYVKNFDNNRDYQDWFNPKSLNQISTWVVALMEHNIIQAYKNYNSEQIFSRINIQRIDMFVKLWKNLGKKQKKKIFQKCDELFDSLPDVCFTVDYDIDYYNKKQQFQNLSNFEFFFKLLCRQQFANLPIDKTKLKQQIKKKIQENVSMGEHDFVSLCIARNLDQNFVLERLFMDHIGIYLEQKFYTSNEFLSENDPDKKKKKRKKKKKKVDKNLDKNNLIEQKEFQETQNKQENLQILKKTLLICESFVSIENQMQNLKIKINQNTEQPLGFQSDESFEDQWQELQIRQPNQYNNQEKKQRETFFKRNQQNLKYTKKDQKNKKITKKKQQQKKVLNKIKTGQNKPQKTQNLSLVIDKQLKILDSLQSVQKKLKIVSIKPQFILDKPKIILYRPKIVFDKPQKQTDDEDTQIIKCENFMDFVKIKKEISLFDFEFQSFIQQHAYVFLKKKFNKLLEKYYQNIASKNKQIQDIRNQSLQYINQQLTLILEKNKISKTNYVIKNYGSYPNDLMTLHSDLDISILIKKQFIDRKALLQIIDSEFEHNQKIFEKKLLLKASFPVLKLKLYFKKKLIQIDIIMEEFEIQQSQDSTLCVSNFIKNYPSFKKNVVIIKNIFGHKNFNNNYNGGLSSYPLSIIYAFFLEYKKLQNSDDLTETLLGFMKFIFHDFDHQKQMLIYNRNDSVFFQKDEKFSAYNLVVINKELNMNNLTNNSLLYDKIRLYLYQTYSKFYKLYKKLLPDSDTKIQDFNYEKINTNYENAAHEMFQYNDLNIFFDLIQQQLMQLINQEKNSKINIFKINLKTFSVFFQFKIFILQIFEQ